MTRFFAMGEIIPLHSHIEILLLSLYCSYHLDDTEAGNSLAQFFEVISYFLLLSLLQAL